MIGVDGGEVAHSYVTATDHRDDDGDGADLSDLDATFGSRRCCNAFLARAALSTVVRRDQVDVGSAARTSDRCQLWVS